jgi:hypothetical protein
VSPYYMRTEAGWRENVTAAAVAFGVGAAVFYLTRILVSREPLEPSAGSGVLSSERQQGQREGVAR